MRTTTAQDITFRAAIISHTLLEEAIDWIQSNMEPGEVFTKEQLESWASDNGYRKEEP